MKNTSFLIIFIISGFGAYAQGTLQDVKEVNIAFGSNPQTMEYFDNFRTIMNTRNKNGSSTVENVKGSPYDNENFLKGTIIFGEKTYKNVWLRYNIYADEVEVKINASKDKNEEIYALNRDPEISFIIKDEKIRYTDLLRKNKRDKTSGNIVVLFEGENYALYKKKLKLYKESKKATTSLQRSFPARFIDSEEYYVKIAEQTPVLIKLKLGDILNFLNDDKKNNVKNYVKENKIAVKKIPQLIQLLKYIDTL